MNTNEPIHIKEVIGQYDPEKQYNVGDIIYIKSLKWYQFIRRFKYWLVHRKAMKGVLKVVKTS